MVNSNLVYDSSPVGKDLYYTFSTIQGGENLDFSLSPVFTITVYDGSGGGRFDQDSNKLITTLTTGVDDSLITLDSTDQTVSVIVPWSKEADESPATGIVQYDSSFTGDVYAYLSIASTGEETKKIGPLLQVVGSDLYQLPTSVFGSDSNVPVNTIGQGTDPVVNDTLKLIGGQALNLDNHTVIYVVKATADDENIALNEVCSIVNPAKGEVTFALKADQLPSPGIYLAAFNIINSEGSVLHQVPRYLQITPNISQGISIERPLTIAEIRLALRDYPVANTLLDEVEYSDEEIIWALTRPIDIWNSTPPALGTYNYNNFPYRAPHLDGAIGELLAAAAHHYMRNELPYQSAGLSVNDKAKASNYLQLSEGLKAKFIAFVERKKYEINVAGGFRFMSGPYDSLGY